MAGEHVDCVVAVSQWIAKEGIAQSQMTLGNWTPEFYAAQTAKYKAELDAALGKAPHAS